VWAVAPPVDPFGISWTSADRRENRDLSLLDFLGFPWILSTESRLINGLRGISRGSFFLSPVLAREAETGAWVEAIRKGGMFMGKTYFNF
jgi:hypothetical protein